MNFSELSLRIKTLTVFRSLLSDPVLSALEKYIDKRAANGATGELFSAYSQFVSNLFTTGFSSLSEYIKDLVENDENVYIKTIGIGKEPSEEISNSVQNELQTFQMLADLTADDLIKGLGDTSFLPRFKENKTELKSHYNHRVENIDKYGYGMYARNRMFYIGGDNAIVPVLHPDETKLSDLIDYDREKKLILDNTYALLNGKPAANVLLTGDAGTGKSSTIKAVVNELYKDGLRILEVRKEQLRKIPSILDELTQNPLKFILFIDDLSFSKNDDDYSALKAILEGSVSAKSNNVVVYATSNRRHLVKESFSDRDGDDIHRNDTMQEIVSLSERFGLQITFNRPDKNTYLSIVKHLVADNNIEIDENELEISAERFALTRGTRSARAARQFVDSLISNQ